MRVRLAAMYDFAVEDCLYHPSCEKRFYIRFGKHRESEDVPPPPPQIVSPENCF